MENPNFKMSPTTPYFVWKKENWFRSRLRRSTNCGDLGKSVHISAPQLFSHLLNGFKRIYTWVKSRWWVRTRWKDRNCHRDVRNSVALSKSLCERSHPKRRPWEVWGPGICILVTSQVIQMLSRVWEPRTLQPSCSLNHFSIPFLVPEISSSCNKRSEEEKEEANKTRPADPASRRPSPSLGSRRRAPAARLHNGPTRALARFPPPPSSLHVRGNRAERPTWRNAGDTRSGSR